MTTLEDHASFVGDDIAALGSARQRCADAHVRPIETIAPRVVPLAAPPP